ncbi:hypothetical protein RQP46_006284 [Phenoliferia psychrophenolica]
MAPPATDPRAPTTDLSDAANAPILKLVSASPNSRFSIDENATAAGTTLLCREAGAGGAKSCVEIQEDITKVFASMVKQGFFCQLPLDPSRTTIECERIEKLLEKK